MGLSLLMHIPKFMKTFFWCNLVTIASSIFYLALLFKDFKWLLASSFLISSLFDSFINRSLSATVEFLWNYSPMLILSFCYTMATVWNFILLIFLVFNHIIYSLESLLLLQNWLCVLSTCYKIRTTATSHLYNFYA